MWTRWIHDGGKGQDEEMIGTRVKMGEDRDKMGTSWGEGTRWGQRTRHKWT